MTFETIRTARMAAVAALLAAVLLEATPSLAQGAQAYTSTNLNQRAGPGTGYPVVAVVPARSPVTIYGCLRDYSWCDAVYGRARGWMSTRYLQVWYQGTYLTVAGYARYVALPVVAFNISTYWPRYYSAFPFYAQLSLYASGSQVSVNIGSFYQPLTPHGDWVLIRGRYVWVPHVNRNWRPYTDGRWVFTRNYGWTWISNEPFGWATYHYGRWAYSPTIGWFWIPGTRWAPAWVVWRSSDEYLAWAPMLPDPSDSFGINIEVSIGSIPNYYWQAVPAHSFLEPNLSTVVIGDNNQVTNIINQTQVIGNVNIVNNVVVNNVVNVNFVEEKTQQQVVAHDLALTSDAAQAGRTEGDTVQIFQPAVADVPATEPPPDVKSVEQVAQQSQTTGQSGDEPGTDELVPPPPPPDEPPPPAEAPPMTGEEQPIVTQETPGVEEAPATPGQPQPCAEGLVLQPDGTCAPPIPAAPGEPPPADQLAPPPAEAPAAEVPAQPEEMAPPSEQAAPPPQLPAPCPEGTVRQDDGSCAPPPEAPPPAEEVAPAQPQPEAAPAPPPQQEPLRPPCPEGYTVSDEGFCVLPEPAQ